MNEKRIRIYISMFLAFVIVVGYESFVTFLVKGDYQKLLALRMAQKPTITVAPTQGAYFEPTITPQPSPTAPKPTNTPIPTSRLYPTSVKAPTRIPTRVPTKAPTKAITKTPTKAPAASGTMSKSKLSAFMINSYTPGSKRILEANPPLIKVIEPNSDPQFYEAIRAYKQRVPQGIAIVRFWNGTSGLYYPVTSDPEVSAQDFFNKVVRPGIDGLGGNKSLFDYMQNPNEFENTPEWRGEANMRWNGAFWRRLTELSTAAGMKPCIAGIPVGNIEAPELQYMIEDLKAMKHMGAAFCYHSYTFNYSQDISHEIYYSLRYRQYYDYFRQHAPELMGMPLILSEGGIAEAGDPKAGYLKSGKIDTYKNWLAWFDGEMRKDSYVKGVTLFQIGNDSDWGYFDLEQIAPWMADYLRSAR